MKLKISTPLSQRDNKWSKIILGFNAVGSQYTLGNYGCTITTLAHYQNSTGKNYTPKTINEYIKTNKGFVPGTGLFSWIGIEDNNFFFRSERFDGVPTPKSFFDQMKRDLDKGYYLMVEVDFDPTLKGEQMHWVGCYGYDDKGFLIMDPWTGELTRLDIYGDPSESVFSYRMYVKTLEIEEETNNTVEELKKINLELTDQLKEANKKIAKFDTVEAAYLLQITEKNNEIDRLNKKEFSVTEAASLLFDAIAKKFSKRV